MNEMNNVAEPEEPEFEPRSRTVSFPDHYRISCIERCMRSKPITCGCSIILIGLAIFSFFATNYMINYPVTKERKIAFVFAGVFSLVAAACCLNLRFRILQQCRPDDNVVFEIAPRDTEISDSFYANFEAQETSCSQETPIEQPLQTEIPGEWSSTAQTIDDPCFADISTIRQNGHGRLPRHSISDGLSEDVPLKLSGPSWVKNGMDSKQLQNSGSVSDISKYPSNYSTFKNGCDASDTEPLLAKSTFGNGCEASDTEPLLAKSTSGNGCDASDTEPLQAK